jgi:hypothetical protein
MCWRFFGPTSPQSRGFRSRVAAWKWGVNPLINSNGKAEICPIRLRTIIYDQRLDGVCSSGTTLRWLVQPHW